MHNQDQKYRHELKYVISMAQLRYLEKAVLPFAKLDSNAMREGFYSIRSVYFDNYYNQCFYENENGTDPREKFRIRIYNNSTERISLECKRKERGKTLKTSCPLTLQQANMLIEGHILPFSQNDPALLRKFVLQCRTRILRPVVIVDYVRIPYVCKNGNVRITFDMNVSSSTHFRDFFSPTLSKKPIFPVGQLLMEIKYDEFLPDVIYRRLNVDQAQATACSKYYLCRKFSSYNGGLKNVIY